jgi:DNA helicase-2/ATP-dependent DNA helicase PcrA
MTSDLLTHLNPPQREAVTHPGGPLLIVAGAGSGKTRVITHRIAWLIREQGVMPHEVFAATFTNKAAEEMRLRVESLLGRRGLSLPIATFHSLCARMLRREAPRIGHTERFTIIDDTDQLGVIRDVIKQLGHRREDCPPAHAQRHINQAKMRMQGPEAFANSLPRIEDEWVVDVFTRYERRLRESDALDFEDLILKTVQMLEEHADYRAECQERFRHVLVDEYQDTNAVQYRLVKLLSGGHHNLCVVGDEDQSIYSWRGADIENILSFQRDHPGAVVVKLEQNYRSSGNILRAASAVIANNTERLGKTLWTDAGDGEPLQIQMFQTDQAEAEMVVQAIQWLRREGVPLNEVSIFYRINALSRRFEERFLEEGMPCRVYGGVRFFERREVKDLIAYLTLVDNPANGVALLRVINTPRRGVGDGTVRKIAERAEELNLNLWDALRSMLEERQIRGKAATGLSDLVALVDEWRSLAGNLSLPELLRRIVEDIAFLAHLEREDPLTHESREENVAELGVSLREFEQMQPDGGLRGYLEKIALESAIDTYDHSEPAVSLMTLHNAKGLEFDVIFLVGVEEAIFPSPRALDDGRNLEEERRLFYVGLTRARKRVHLSWAQSRFRHGSAFWNSPSPFLREIPREALERSDDLSHGVHRQKTFANSAAADMTGRFHTGERVSHAAFGEGTILGTKGEGALRKILIRFEGDELVELLERYAELTPSD